MWLGICCIVSGFNILNISYIILSTAFVIFIFWTKYYSFCYQSHLYWVSGFVNLTIEWNENQPVSFCFELPLLNKRFTFAILRWCLSISALKGIGTCGLWQRGATIIWGDILLRLKKTHGNRPNTSKSEKIFINLTTLCSILRFYHATLLKTHNPREHAIERICISLITSF